MQAKTKAILALTGGAIGIAVIAVLVTLGIQKLNTAPPPPPPIVQAPPAPPMAQVITVQPHFVSENTTVNKCHPVKSTTYQQEPVQNKNSGNVAGTLAGGALGGLAGSAIHGSARTAAILAGAGLGAYAGHQIQANNQQPQYKSVPHTSTSTQCADQTVTRKLQQGYEVTYVYNGAQSMILMDAPPASGTIPLPGYIPPTTTTPGTPASTDAGASAAGAPPSTYSPPVPVTMPSNQSS